MAVVINGSGTVTGLAVGGLPDGTVDAGTLATDSVTAAKLKDDAIAVGDLPAGSVLQVVSTTKTDIYSVSLGNGSESGDVTGLTRTITPSSTSSKILVRFTLTTANSDTHSIHTTLYKDGSPLIRGDASGSRSRVSASAQNSHSEGTQQISFEYLDSPSTTSQITYSIRLRHGTAGTVTAYVNRSNGDPNASYGARDASTITAMEIGA